MEISRAIFNKQCANLMVPCPSGSAAAMVRFGDLTFDQQSAFLNGFPVNVEDTDQMEATDGATTQETDGEFKLFTVRKNPRKRNNDQVNEQPLKNQKTIPNTAEIKPKSVNKFAALREELLNDKNVKSNVKLTENAKRIRTPKTKFITINSAGKTREIIKALSAVDQCSFTASPSGEFTKIFPDNPESYRKIITQLDALQVQHFLLPEKSTAPLKVVIRGLPIDTPIEQIEEELKSLEYEIIKVNQMLKFSNKKPMPLFQIHLVDNDKSRDIFKLDQLSHFIIKIESYMRPSRTMQCFKCQFFHHSSQYCKMAPRCVKCSGPHDAKECPLGKKLNENVVCCNCGGNHPASYRGCPKFPENIRKSFAAKKVAEGTSYASTLKPKPPQPKQTATPAPPLNKYNASLDDLQNILNLIAQEFNVNDFSELVDKFKNVLALIKNAPDQLTKLSILMGALKSEQPSSAPNGE